MKGSSMSNNYFPAWIGWPQNRTAIIAEIGMNHGGDEDMAWEMIKAAHVSGADFVKLQSFVTEKFFHPSLSYFANTKAMELSFEAQRRLFKRAEARGVKLITTPFDFESVDLAEEFNPAAHKIASMDNDNLPLLRYVAAKGRPVAVSCGMADLGEIERVVTNMRTAGNDKLVLLHCVSDYPAAPENLNLAMMDLLRSAFKTPTGLSDHSIGLHSAFIAAARGAAVIEKHFTIDRTLHEKFPDADHNISLEPSELKTLRAFCESVSVMTGEAPRRLTENETVGRTDFRRGLYSKRDLVQGEEISLENTILLRPAKGIAAGAWDFVCGKEVKRPVSKGSPIFYSDLGL